MHILLLPSLFSTFDFLKHRWNDPFNAVGSNLRRSLIKALDKGFARLSVPKVRAINCSSMYVCSSSASFINPFFPFQQKAKAEREFPISKTLLCHLGWSQPLSVKKDHAIRLYFSMYEGSQCIYWQQALRDGYFLKSQSYLLYLLVVHCFEKQSGSRKIKLYYYMI